MTQGVMGSVMLSTNRRHAGAADGLAENHPTSTWLPPSRFRCHMPPAWAAKGDQCLGRELISHVPFVPIRSDSPSSLVPISLLGLGESGDACRKASTGSQALRYQRTQCTRRPSKPPGLFHGALQDPSPPRP